MTIQTYDTGKTITLKVEGEIDHTGAETLKSSFSRLSLSGKAHVVFDFQKVGYIGSAGLGKLLLFYKRLSAENIQLTVQAPPKIRDLLRELKMDTLFTVG